MKRFSRFNSSARLPELVTGFERVLSWLDTLSVEGDEYLAGKKAELDRLTKLTTALMKKDKTYSNLEELDTARDNIAKKFFKLTEGYTAHPEPKVSDSANKLYNNVYKKYSSLIRENYEAESGLLSSMFGDLESAEAKEQIANLDGVAKLIEMLKEANTAFELEHKAYVSAKDEAKGEKSATSIKKEALALVNDDIVPYLAAMRKVKAEQYEKIASMIDNEIKTVNDKILVRSNAGTEKKNA